VVAPKKTVKAPQKKAPAKKAVAKKAVKKTAAVKKKTPVAPKKAAPKKAASKKIAQKVAKPAAKPVTKPKAIAKPEVAAKPKVAAKTKPATKPRTVKTPAPQPVQAPLLDASVMVAHEEGAPVVESPTDALPEAAPKLRRTKPKKPAEDGPVTVLSTVLAQLDDAKAEQVVTIGLDDKSAIADTMVVASGRSARHVGAIADQIVEKLKEAGFRDLRIEGMPQCDWVLVDAGDVVVHIFRPEVRSFYNLEKLWSAHAPNERLPI
jgi:ribosome-associated protein